VLRQLQKLRSMPNELVEDKKDKVFLPLLKVKKLGPQRKHSTIRKLAKKSLKTFDLEHRVTTFEEVGMTDPLRPYTNLQSVIRYVEQLNFD